MRSEAGDKESIRYVKSAVRSSRDDGDEGVSTKESTCYEPFHLSRISAPSIGRSRQG
jgi:hypothetical protein